MTGLSPEDGAATLVRFTCETITANLAHVPTLPKRLLVTGGGRHNPNMMRMLAQISGFDVEPVESVGWMGMPSRRRHSRSSQSGRCEDCAKSSPSTTGVPKPMPGGRPSLGRLTQMVLMAASEVLAGRKHIDRRW